MENKYNTNLASEFFVMSMLYRKGLDAYLTFGNKKGVDIMVKKNDGSTIKLEVKGVNKSSDPWPISSRDIEDSPDLYFVLLSYGNHISDLSKQPKVWIVPSLVIKNTCRTANSVTRNHLRYLLQKEVRDTFLQYDNNWAPIENTPRT